LTPINGHDYVAGWSPDGSTLVLSNAINDENTVGLGPFTLTAVTFLPSGRAKFTTLTHNSMSFIFLGFIRSA
jgi:Tol biopolymer transport system component